MRYSDLNYTLGQRVVGVLPVHGPTANLNYVESSNTAMPTRVWAQSHKFMLVEGFVTMLARGGTYGLQEGAERPLLEVAINSAHDNGTEWGGYWNIEHTTLLAIARNVADNPHISDETKKFILDHLLPVPLSTPGYDSLLRDISRAAGLTGGVEPCSAEAVRAEATRLGLGVCNPEALANVYQPITVRRNTATELDDMVAQLKANLGADSAVPEPGADVPEVDVAPDWAMPAAEYATTTGPVRLDFGNIRHSPPSDGESTF